MQNDTIKINNCPICDRSSDVVDFNNNLHEIRCLECDLILIKIDTEFFLDENFICIWNNIMYYINKEHLDEQEWKIECNFYILYYDLLNKSKLNEYT